MRFRSSQRVGHVLGKTGRVAWRKGLCGASLLGAYKVQGEHLGERLAACLKLCALGRVQGSVAASVGRLRVQGQEGSMLDMGGGTLKLLVHKPCW